MSAEPTSNRSSSADAQGRRLESWKEIAAYLARDVTTVRRWERREGLPVRRLVHSKLGSVFAYTTDLDAWREAGGSPAALRIAVCQANATGLGEAVAGRQTGVLARLGNVVLQRLR